MEIADPVPPTWPSAQVEHSSHSNTIGSTTPTRSQEVCEQHTIASIRRKVKYSHSGQTPTLMVNPLRLLWCTHGGHDTKKIPQ